MELHLVDPTTLILTVAGLRRTAPLPKSDAQLTANVCENGLLQPPLVRTLDDRSAVVVGSRASIAADLAQIPELVVGGDAIRASSENIQRLHMNPVDKWRAIDASVSDKWSEAAIAVVMGLAPRRVRLFRLPNRNRRAAIRPR